MLDELANSAILSLKTFFFWRLLKKFKLEKVLKKAYQNLIGDSRSINKCLIRSMDWLIDYSSIKFLWHSAILQITAEFFLINLQKPVKLLNFADFMKKFCGNLQKLQLCRTSQKCAKKVQKKMRRTANFAVFRRSAP
jgi:hypothetical protein